MVEEGSKDSFKEVNTDSIHSEQPKIEIVEDTAPNTQNAMPESKEKNIDEPQIKQQEMQEVTESPKEHSTHHESHKTKHEHSPKQVKEHEGDDVIDLKEMKNKAKNFFKGLKGKKEKPHKDHQSKESKGDKEDISLGIAETTAFFKKNAKWLIPVVLILIAVVASSYFRLMPSHLPATDDWAQNTVHDHYRNQLRAQINAQYPNLPQQNRDALVETEFQKQLQEQKDRFDQELEQVSNQYKSQLQDDNGNTYLLAIDPYFWFTQTKNYVNHGTLGDAFNDEGENIISVRNGRFGSKTTKIPFHPVASAWVYNILHLFNSNITIMRAVFLMPVLIIALALIPAFFIGRRIAGNFAGFLAAFMIAINGTLLSRTPAGFSDTDPYNIFFPLFIIWLFIESYYAKNTRNRVIWGAVGGFLTGLYAITWLGYWYIFLFILAGVGISLVFYLVSYYLREKKVKGILNLKQFKNMLVSGASYLISSAVFVSLFAGFERFIFLFRAPLKVVALKDVGVTTLWPNVLTTVAEFNEVNVSNIVSQMGGQLLFGIALIGMALLLYKKGKKKANVTYLAIALIYYLVLLGTYQQISDPIALAILLVLPVFVGLIKSLYAKENVEILIPVLLAIWFAATVFGFSRGIRFALLMVPAFALAFAACIGIVIKMLQNSMSKALKISKTVVNVVLIAATILLLIAPLNNAQGIGKSEIPSMNDAWHGALTKIKDDSQKAIITSWWDFGHWFYAISERSVTFDGAGQGERIHWVGQSLLTPHEDQAVGTLRMLNCGQQQAVHKIEEALDGDIVRAVDVLNEMMKPNDRNEAAKILEREGISSTQVQDILSVSYCDDLLDQYFITSEDMVSKAGVWGHFGSWDFERAQMYQETRDAPRAQALEILKTKYGLDDNEANKVHSEIQTTKADNWVAPWPGYQGSAGCVHDGDTLACDFSANGGTARLFIDLVTKEVHLNGEGGTKIRPNTFVYIEDGEIKEKKYEGGERLGVSVVLLPSNSILLTHELQANSMFTKLFFLDGEGLECFEKFDDRRQFSGGRIITWKVDLECQA